MTSTDTLTRERWLELAIDTYWRPRFAELGYPLPERFHVSVGFGHGAKRESANIEAQCWSRTASADAVNHIFICPTVASTTHVLALLGHELAHAALDSDAGIQDGHVKRFAAIMTQLGFEGPMTSTQTTAELEVDLVIVATELGDYPHGALDVTRARTRTEVPVPRGGGGGGPKIRTGPPPQRSRRIKCECPCCGYAVDTTRKWIALGAPRCPGGTEMLILS